MAVDMTHILAKSKDADIKALYLKYGPQLVIAVDKPGIGRSFKRKLGGVELDIARVKRGNEVYPYHEVAFHEFGHMIDWLFSGRKGLTSNGSGIVECIDNDWTSYIGKAAKRKASDKFNDLPKNDPSEAIRLIREWAKEIGERSVVRLCREATRANRECGTGWRTLFVRLIDDEQFAKVADSLLDSNARWEPKYNKRAEQPGNCRLEEAHKRKDEAFVLRCERRYRRSNGSTVSAWGRTWQRLFHGCAER